MRFILCRVGVCIHEEAKNAHPWNRGVLIAAGSIVANNQSSVAQAMSSWAR
jgi:hypothetical protein